MTTLQQIIRILISALIGLAVGFVLPVPWVGPTVAVLIFVLLSFFLRCLSTVSTIVFVLFVASVPVLAFAFGLSFHTPVIESTFSSIKGFFSQPSLIVIFFVAPSFLGGLLHFLLIRHVKPRDR